MKFSTITISALSIISAHARRRHLSIIKGEESDGSMSMAESVLYPAKGGGSSKSKSAPTPAPTPEVCDLCLCYIVDYSVCIMSYNISCVIVYYVGKTIIILV